MTANKVSDTTDKGPLFIKNYIYEKYYDRITPANGKINIDPRRLQYQLQQKGISIDLPDAEAAIQKTITDTFPNVKIKKETHYLFPCQLYYVYNIYKSE
jgi:hypothetical protein